MIDTVVKLLPALLGIAAGHLLRLGGIAERCDADFTFLLILLPTLAFTALSQVSIDRNLAIFPLAIPRAWGRRRSAAAAEDHASITVTAHIYAISTTTNSTMWRRGWMRMMNRNVGHV